MKGEVAQLCTLACHANSYLSGSGIPKSFNDNSTFKYCGAVEFSHEKKGYLWGKSKKSVATNPTDWLHWLSSGKVRRSWLTVMSRSDYLRSNEYADDYKTSAFVGGGSVWVITTQTIDGRSFSWVPIWQHQKSEPPLSKPWKVEYQAFNDTRSFEVPDTAAATEILRSALTDIHRFATDLEIPFWPSLFERASGWLEGTESDLHHNDLCPEGALSADARRLLYACQTSWVFGGMGSWNDIYETQNPKYPIVSKALFNAVNSGIVAAVNSSASEL
jgi:hypothetical protein